MASYLWRRNYFKIKCGKIRSHSIHQHSCAFTPIEHNPHNFSSFSYFCRVLAFTVFCSAKPGNLYITPVRKQNSLLVNLRIPESRAVWRAAYFLPEAESDYSVFSPGFSCLGKSQLHITKAYCATFT
jgi:hypothetical protein